MAVEDRFKPVNEVAKKKESVIKNSADLIKEASRKILNIQSGEETPLITRYNHLNENLLGGFYNGVIVSIAALSGFGKSTILKHIEDDLFDKSLNEHCDEVVLLKCNYEMTIFNLLLRRLKEGMKKKMKNILSKKFSETEESVFEDIVLKESNPNIYYIEKPLTPKEWYEVVKEFIISHSDKKSICISIDHLALVKDNGNKKQSMDEMIDYMNELKKEFPNVFFIILSQMNRELEVRTDIKNMQPKASDLYNSSNIMFISDVVLIIHNPFKLGIMKYMLFSPSRYPHLTDFMYDSNRDYTNFETKNTIMWHYIKIRQDDREPDEEKDNTLYIERLYPTTIKQFDTEYKVAKLAKKELPKYDPNDKGIWGDLPVTETKKQVDEDDSEDYPF